MNNPCSQKENTVNSPPKDIAPLRGLLTTGLEFLGIEVNEGLIKKFIFYLKELQKWNRAYNITSLKNEKDIIEKHFLDSLLYLPFLKEHISVADVGSGGGFPGLVLKIVRPDLLMHLIEPSRKRAAFLKYLIFKLNLSGVEVHPKRVQEVTSLKVDAVVSRAVFKLREIIKFSRPILKEGGIIILNKGPEAYKEIAEAIGGASNSEELKEALKIDLVERVLPGTDIKRNMIVVKL